MNQLINWNGTTEPINELQRHAIEDSLKCFACGNRHFAGNHFTGYLWRAEKDSGRRMLPDPWNIWAVTECGAQANTEIVACFVGQYHNAEANCKEACDAHNRIVYQKAEAVQRFLECAPNVINSQAQINGESE